MDVCVHVHGYMHAYVRVFLCKHVCVSVCVCVCGAVNPSLLFVPFGTVIQHVPIPKSQFPDRSPTLPSYVGPRYGGMFNIGPKFYTFQDSSAGY